MGKDLSEQFGVHVAVVAFSPVGEPRALGSSTAESVLRTYHTDAAPPPISSGASRQHGDRGDQGGRETEETRALVAVEWARVAAAMERVREAHASARKWNWWEVDVEAVGEEEIPVFVSALEMIWAEVEDRIDAMETERLPLPWKEEKLP